MPAIDQEMPPWQKTDLCRVYRAGCVILQRTLPEPLFRLLPPDAPHRPMQTRLRRELKALGAKYGLRSNVPMGRVWGALNVHLLHGIVNLGGSSKPFQIP